MQQHHHHHHHRGACGGVRQPPTPTQLQRRTALRRKVATTAAAAAAQPTVVVVGAGWAGLGAALAAAKADARVKLISVGNPGGLSAAFITPNGRTHEPGIKGVWRDYANISALLSDELGLHADDLLTPFARSGWYTPTRGLVVSAPVFGDLPRLPTPLHTLWHTLGAFDPGALPLADRATAAPLAGPWLLHDLDDAAYRDLDKVSARDLFTGGVAGVAGVPAVSPKLYEAFLAPMLSLLLFAPPERLSAAAALGALDFFALRSGDAMDVRWPRGSYSELVFKPLAARLRELGVELLSGRRVVDVLPAGGEGGEDGGGASPASTSGRRWRQRRDLPAAGAVIARRVGEGGGGSGGGGGGGRGGGGDFERHECDAVVLALGLSQLQGLVTASGFLASNERLRRVAAAAEHTDALAIRVWYEGPRLALPFVSNVLSGFDAGVGGTLFDVSALQQQQQQQRRRPSNEKEEDVTTNVIEVDFYGAGPLLSLTDRELVSRVFVEYLPAVLAGGRRPRPRGGGNDASSLGLLAAARERCAAAAARVVDSSVVRVGRGITCFSPGSADVLPPCGLLPGTANVLVAGDFCSSLPSAEVHGSKGLAQERAYATGLVSGNQAARAVGLRPRHTVLAASPPEPPIAAAKEALRVARQLGLS
jgi:hypothetical protein